MKSIGIIIDMILLFGLLCTHTLASEVQCQGVDDTEAILAALPDAVLFGNCVTGYVYIPYGSVSGNATVTPYLNWSGPYFWQAGDGVQLSGLTFASEGADVVLYSEYTSGVRFIDLDVSGGQTHNIQLKGTQNPLVQNCTIHKTGEAFNISFWNVYEGQILNNELYDSRAESVNLLNSNSCLVQGNTAYWTAPGISTDFGMSIWGDEEYSNNNRFIGNTISMSGKAGIAIADMGIGNQILNNIVFHPNQLGLPLSRGGQASILLYGKGAVHNTVEGCKIFQAQKKAPGVIQANLGTGKAHGNKITPNKVY